MKPTPIVIIVPASQGGFRWTVFGTRLARGVEPTRFFAREKAILALEAQGYWPLVEVLP